MAADSVQVKKDKLDQSQLIDDCEYPAYPCILIARLAVDKKLHGYGVGSYLLSLAIGYAMESPLGCRYLAVDPKDGALDFYKIFGFRFWTKSNRRMFLNMRDVSEQMQMNESLDFWTRTHGPESKSSTG
jgi:GNAT superfamily N-acetyltransferase